MDRGTRRLENRGHGQSTLLERARSLPDARVAFERLRDVTGRCPQCEGLLTRRVGPGLLCSCCGRLWLVRELLRQEIGASAGA